MRYNVSAEVAALVAIVAALVACGGCGQSGEQPLLCYVGGTMRPVMDALAKAYEEQTGRKVELDYGDSGSNLIKAETSGQGDLYVAHDPFHGAIAAKGLGREGWFVARLRAMIAVPKGNPKNIRGLKDLARPGVRVILTDATHSTAGHVAALMARKAGLEAAIEKNVVTRTRMGGEAANAVIFGHADAAVVWQAVIFERRDRLDAVPIDPAWQPQPGVDAVTSATFGPIDMGMIRVTIDVLRSSARPEEARAFAEFAASPAAAKVWEAKGFDLPPSGPVRLVDAGQSESPAPPEPQAALLVYAGAGLKPALDDLAAAFKAKTGARVQCDYGGSGQVISRLRLAREGDLFMPGDAWYIDLAEKEDLVASRAAVCYFVPVILVEKGNPKGIRGLADLVRPGIRLGLGNPKACQVGRTSEAIFAKNGIPAEDVARNLAFSSVTVNELGMQVTMGQLDAAIVWDATAALYAGKADAVPIPLAQSEVAGVAAAVLKFSKQPAAARQFVDFLRSAEGQAIFRKHQFRTEPPK